MIRALLKSILHSKRGNAAVELGLISPVLLTMALGGVDVAMGYAHKMKMQHFAQIGADFVIATIEYEPKASEVRDVIIDATGLSSSNIKIDEWLECDGVIEKSLPSCLKVDAEVVKFMEITVTQAYEPMLNITDYADFVGKSRHSGTVTVRTK